MDVHDSRRTVVVGIDGSEDSARAVVWGAAAAGRRHIPLRLVHAFGWGPGDVVGHPELGQRHRDVLLAPARGQIHDAAEAARAQTPDLVVEAARGVDADVPPGVRRTPRGARPSGPRPFVTPSPAGAR